MPLTKKGKKIMRSMKEQYGPKEGESVFYASRNKGTIKGVEKNMGKKKQTGGIINPIQPMYNPTQADQQRQNAMMQGQQQMMTQPQAQAAPKGVTDNPMQEEKKAEGMFKGGSLREPPEGAKGKGLKKLPTEVRNKMGFKNRGGLINNGNKDYRKSGMFYNKGNK